MTIGFRSQHLLLCALLQGALQSLKMANAVASYDQLAHQVEVLRKENSHLRRELEDNSNHLSKLETETTGMKVSVDTRLRFKGTML